MNSIFPKIKQFLSGAAVLTTLACGETPVTRHHADHLPFQNQLNGNDKDQVKAWDGELLVASGEKDSNGSGHLYFYSKVALSRLLVQVESGGWILSSPLNSTSKGYLIRKSNHKIKVGPFLKVVATDGNHGFSFDFEAQEKDQKLAFKQTAISPSISALLKDPPKIFPGSAATETKIAPESDDSPSYPSRHPPFKNAYHYPRQIDPQLQARAQSEANILARYSYAENQRRWTSSGGALGHPVGVPSGYVGGTGCSWPSAKPGWQSLGQNEIATCEPGGSRFVLVAEAVAFNAQDGVWYASRIWKPY